MVTVEGAVGITAVRNKPTAITGGSLLMDIGLPVRFGGGGWILMTTPTVPGGQNGYDLHLAYGGALLEVPIATRGPASVTVRTLFGLGNAKVSLTTLISADNFGVVEPELVGALRLFRQLHVTMGGSFRFVFGVDDLANVAPVDLRGASARVGLSLRGF